MIGPYKPPILRRKQMHSSKPANLPNAANQAKCSKDSHLLRTSVAFKPPVSLERNMSRNRAVKGRKNGIGGCK